MSHIIMDIKSNKICIELEKMYRECSDMRNDGWTAFGYKQSLIRIKYHLESLLNKCPKFSGEEEFIESIEKDITWDTLKNDFR